ncbi:MAG: hypothetical protein K0Q74_884 [Gammaproteobacteria bacterium]|jgi:hygromycin-B 7''-O-kinase|nr:hypothetical protein [Gammaproteobacteria bacterium]
MLEKPILPLIHSFEEYEKFKQQTESLEDAAKKIIYRHQLPDLPLALFSEGTNVVFAYGKNQVIKIFPPFHQNQYQSERLVLQQVQNKLPVKTPTLQYHGELSGWPYIVTSQLQGTLLETLWEGMSHANKATILSELGTLIKEVHALPIDGLEAIDSHWEQFIEKQIAHCVKQHQSNQLPEELLQQIPDFLDSAKAILPKINRPVILTGEYTPMNLLVKQLDGTWHIDGLIDFGDAMLGLPEYDLLGPGAFLIQGDKALLKNFLIAYGYTREKLTKNLSRQLTTLMLLHQYSNLNIQVRIAGWEKKVKTIEDLENLVWGF